MKTISLCAFCTTSKSTLSKCIFPPDIIQITLKEHIMNHQTACSRFIVILIQYVPQVNSLTALWHGLRKWTRKRFRPISFWTGNAFDKLFF